MRQEQKLPPKGRITRTDLDAAATRDSQKGRGTSTNQAGRFERETKHTFDDGWNTIEDEPATIRTTLRTDTARTIITFNKSPDISFDRSINPYRGCEHGCVYCFARPTHAFAGHSPGIDFESLLYKKSNAPELLKRELSRPGYLPRTIALGVNTDAFQPVERDEGLTRELLQILSDCNHPVTLITKSTLIQRDIDILAPMAAKGLARVGISITTLDRRLARKMEPRAATPGRRLDTIRALSDAGIDVTVMVAPIIPALTDHELEAILDASASHGATSAGFVLLRLPYEIKDLFHEWLVTHAPDRATRVINTIRDMRGGKDYDARWFERGRGRGPIAALIAQRFAKASARYSLDGPRTQLRTDLFRPAESPGGQLRLNI